MTPSINGVEIPDSFAWHGNYEPPFRSIAHYNGNNIPVLSGQIMARWTFRILTYAEYAWWAFTILGGANRYLECDVRIWNEHSEEATYTNAIVVMPVRPQRRNGYYHSVVIEFHRLTESNQWYFDTGEFFDSGLAFW